MGLLAERLAIGIGRVARVIALLVGVGPLGWIWLADGVVQHVMRIGITPAVPGIAARWFWKPGRRLAFGRLLELALVFALHGPCLPDAVRAQTLQAADRG